MSITCIACVLRTSGCPAMTTVSPSVSPSIRSLSVPCTLWLPSTGSASPDSPGINTTHQQQTYLESLDLECWSISSEVSVDTLVLSVAVAVPCSAHSVMFSLVLAGSSFAPKQAAGLVNNAGQSLQRLKSSIHCVGHVGTKPNYVKKEYAVILHWWQSQIDFETELLNMQVKNVSMIQEIQDYKRVLSTLG